MQTQLVDARLTAQMFHYSFHHCNETIHCSVQWLTEAHKKWDVNKHTWLDNPNPDEITSGQSIRSNFCHAELCLIIPQQVFRHEVFRQ